MPVLLSTHIGVAPTAIKRQGALDPVLDSDTHLFIDPKLLSATKVPELRGSYGRLQQHFMTIIKLLRQSQDPGDIFWRNADKLMRYGEVKGLCIGYSAKGTSGSGMGRELRGRILQTAKAIIDAGTRDPEIFEVVGLFEEDVGADRISDMIANIVIGDILKFSSRVYSKLGVIGSPVTLGGFVGHAPVNPFNNAPILLVPRSILRDLPMARDWSDVDHVAAENARLRKQVNDLIGNTWKSASRVRKSDVKRAILAHPELVRDLIKQYKEKGAIEYDFDEDRSGEVVWLPLAIRAVADFPLELTVPQKRTIENLEQIVDKICNHFKSLIENNNFSKDLYLNTGKPKHEHAAQRMFFGMASLYCQELDIDISAEANAGRGPVDFKFSVGHSRKVVVEVKLTTNGKLISGFQNQVTAYMNAESTRRGCYLVLDVGGTKKFKDRFRKVVNDSNSVYPKVIWVDGAVKKTGSKA